MVNKFVAELVSPTRMSVFPRMNRTFLWEAGQVARQRAPEYLALQRITSVSANGIVNIAVHGGYANQQVKRLAAGPARWTCRRRSGDGRPGIGGSGGSRRSP